MAKAIVELKARRNPKGRLAVYELPAGDGGGRYEVAGINDRYHKAEVDHVVDLIKAGKQDEAETYVAEFIAKYTDVVISWSSQRRPALNHKKKKPRGEGGASNQG